MLAGTLGSMVALQTKNSHDRPPVMRYPMSCVFYYIEYLNSRVSMAQAELFDIASPCVQVCEMDDKGYCKGCLRNRTERQLWHAMNDEQKRQVLRLLFIRQKKRSHSLLAPQTTEDSHALP